MLVPKQRHRSHILGDHGLSLSSHILKSLSFIRGPVKRDEKLVSREAKEGWGDGVYDPH